MNVGLCIYLCVCVFEYAYVCALCMCVGVCMCVYVLFSFSCRLYMYITELCFLTVQQALPGDSMSVEKFDLFKKHDVGGLQDSLYGKTAGCEFSFVRCVDQCLAIHCLGITLGQ